MANTPEITDSWPDHEMEQIMSLLKPKDGDYAVRGLFLLIGWICVIAPGPFAIAGGLLAGAGGTAIGLLVGIFAGIGAYSWYLKFGLRQAG